MEEDLFDMQFAKFSISSNKIFENNVGFVDGKVRLLRIQFEWSDFFQLKNFTEMKKALNQIDDAFIRMSKDNPAGLHNGFHANYQQALILMF